MNPKQIIEILHSIQDVKLDPKAQDGLKVKFTEPDPVWLDGWEANSGYVYGSFTEQLLDLIESSLNGEMVETTDTDEEVDLKTLNLAKVQRKLSHNKYDLVASIKYSATNGYSGEVKWTETDIYSRETEGFATEYEVLIALWSIF